MSKKVLSIRITKTMEENFRRYCEENGTNMSSRIEELIEKDIKPKFPDLIAGKNRIQYNASNDSFDWVIITDKTLPVEMEIGNDTKIVDLSEFVIVKGMSKEYIEELSEKIRLALKERDYKIRKSDSKSIGVKSDLIGGNIE